MSVKKIAISSDENKIISFAKENNLLGTNKIEIIEQNKELIKDGFIYLELDQQDTQTFTTKVADALANGAEIYYVVKHGFSLEPFSSELPDGDYPIQVACMIEYDNIIRLVYNKGNYTALAGVMIGRKTVVRTWLSIEDAKAVISNGVRVQAQLAKHNQNGYEVYESMMTFKGGRPVAGQFNNSIFHNSQSPNNSYYQNEISSIPKKSSRELAIEKNLERVNRSSTTMNGIAFRNQSKIKNGKCRIVIGITYSGNLKLMGTGRSVAAYDLNNKVYTWVSFSDAEIILKTGVAIDPKGTDAEEFFEGYEVTALDVIFNNGHLLLDSYESYQDIKNTILVESEPKIHSVPSTISESKKIGALESKIKRLEAEIKQLQNFTNQANNNVTLLVDDKYLNEIKERSELYLYEELKKLHFSHQVKWLNYNFTTESFNESYESYDFEVLDGNGNVLHYIDCKATPYEKKTFYLTNNEWDFFLKCIAQNKSYQIYRVYNLETSPNYIVIDNLKEWLDTGRVVPYLLEVETVREQRVCLTLV